jgi:hypothetical protein
MNINLVSRYMCHVKEIRKAITSEMHNIKDLRLQPKAYE